MRSFFPHSSLTLSFSNFFFFYLYARELCQKQGSFAYFFKFSHFLMNLAHGDQLDRLDGDQEKITYINAEGVIQCSDHHDDQEGADWHIDDRVDLGRGVVYRDTTRATPVPDVPWQLMEPASHKVRRRRWLCSPNSCFS